LEVTSVVSAIVALALVGPVADGAEVSQSKLSLHLIGEYTPGARRVVAAGPRVLKVLDLDGAMLEALRDYRRAYPGGKTVVRIYTPPFALGDDPEAGARLFWGKVLEPAVTGLSTDDRALIDYLEGPNECEQFDAWTSVSHAAWYARFWRALARLIAQAGFRPCVGSIPVGNPPGSPAEVEARFEAFVPALSTAHQLGGAWSYHSYSLKYTTGMGEESWTSLRYRMLHRVLEERHAELTALPLIMTEAGVDLGGSPDTDGWQARGDTSRFEQWLAWYDDELRKDPYVLGATLFQSGCPHGWHSFEVEPVTEWLVGQLRGGRGT
jgi:hypothetical protein